MYYYLNRWYKSYITSLKAAIAGKSLNFARMDIDRNLHFVFYDKILQIYRQHWTPNPPPLPNPPLGTPLLISLT